MPCRQNDGTTSWSVRLDGNSSAISSYGAPILSTVCVLSPLWVLMPWQPPASREANRIAPHTYASIRVASRAGGFHAIHDSPRRSWVARELPCRRGNCGPTQVTIKTRAGEYPPALYCYDSLPTTENQCGIMIYESRRPIMSPSTDPCFTGKFSKGLALAGVLSAGAGAGGPDHPHLAWRSGLPTPVAISNTQLILKPARGRSPGLCVPPFVASTSGCLRLRRRQACRGRAGIFCAQAHKRARLAGALLETREAGARADTTPGGPSGRRCRPACILDTMMIEDSGKGECACRIRR